MRKYLTQVSLMHQAGIIFAVLSFLGVVMSQQAWSVSFSFTIIDVPGAGRFTQAFGINNSGQIVSDFQDSSFTVHGFLATPVPEPSALFLLAAALGMAA